MRDLPSIRVSVAGAMAATMVAVSVAVSSWGVVAAAQGSSGSVTPTPLEQAVMEHNCRVPGQAMRAAELQDVCLRDQLTYLRAEFGRDLRKLSAGERGKIDRACSALRVERGRDEYIACLSDRLTRLTKARGRAVPSVPAGTASTANAPTAGESPVMPVDGVTTSDPPPAEASAHESGRSLATLLSGLSWLGALVVILCGVAWGLKARRRPKPALAFCRVCGEPAQTGDLCAMCRHEAAEAQRRTAADRSDVAAPTNDCVNQPETPRGVGGRVEATVAGASQENAPTVTTEAAEVSQAQALEARRREHEQAVQLRIDREREEARQQEAERRRWQEAAAAAIAEDSPIDPHTVLGVSPDATPDQIRAAYEEAKQKYAPDLVSHLSSEIQERYRTKAQAVERAYELLVGQPRTNA